MDNYHSNTERIRTKKPRSIHFSKWKYHFNMCSKVTASAILFDRLANWTELVKWFLTVIGDNDILYLIHTIFIFIWPTELGLPTFSLYQSLKTSAQFLFFVRHFKERSILNSQKVTVNTAMRFTSSSTRVKKKLSPFSCRGSLFFPRSFIVISHYFSYFIVFSLCFFLLADIFEWVIK